MPRRTVEPRAFLQARVELVLLELPQRRDRCLRPDVRPTRCVVDILNAVLEGTEYASALLAGAASLFIEAYPERGPMAVLDALEASAATRTSDFLRVPRLAPAILFPDGVAALPSEDITGGGTVTTLTPRFRWDVPTLHPLGLPTTFRLELAEDSLFQSPVLSDSVVGTFARRIQEPLPPRSRPVQPVASGWRFPVRLLQHGSWFDSEDYAASCPDRGYR